jgi:protein gp37
MSAKTKIEWTDKTWSPVRGCSRVSPGCEHCYAETMASRFSGPGRAFEGYAKGGRWTGRVSLIPDLLKIPFSWKVPSRIFVNSMSDTFHEKLAFAEIDQIFAVMALCVDHTFQVLTKRADRMLEYFNCTRGGSTASRVLAAAEFIARRRGEEVDSQFWDTFHEWPIPHVWIGVSVEDQKRADERIPVLMKTPASCRFVSAEPLLGAVDLRPFFGRCPIICEFCHKIAYGMQMPPGWDLVLQSYVCPSCIVRVQQGGGYNVVKCGAYATAPDPRPWGKKVDWVIVGGESGPGSRGCDLGWVRKIVEDCKTAHVATFVKQLGARPVCSSRITPENKLVYDNVSKILDFKGGDISEFPEDLRVREFPKVRE